MKKFTLKRGIMKEEPFGLALRPVELQDKQIFKSYLAIQNRRSCECNFGNIFAWAEAYQLEWIEIEGRLLVYSAKERILQMPLGNFPPPRELLAVLEAFREEKPVAGIYDVPEIYPVIFPDAREYFAIDDSADNYDYVYSVASMCRLEGRKLRKKRNLVKQFRHQYPNFVCRPMEFSDSATVLELARRLNNGQGDTRFVMEESGAVERVLEHFDELEMEGLMLWASPDEPVGFAIFSPTTSDTYNVHFEKTDREYKGASQTLTRQVACHLHGRCRYLNREQDLGSPGLRQAKQSLDPVFMEKRLMLALI